MSLSAVFKVPMVNEVKEGRGKVERNPLSSVWKNAKVVQICM